MQTVADRIVQKMNELDVSQAILHRKTGAGKATISSWVDGKTEPSSKYIPVLAQLFKVSSDWLLTGKETFYNNNHGNQVNNSHIGGSFNQSVSHHYAGEDLVSLDFYPKANLAAPKQTFCSTRQTLPTNADFATVATDNLMHPTIRQKSIVVARKVDDHEPIYPSKVYVVAMGGLLMCRYLERLTGGRMRVYSEYDKTGTTLTQDEFTQEYQIMGSVVWWSSFME